MRIKHVFESKLRVSAGGVGKGSIAPASSHLGRSPAHEPAFRGRHGAGRRSDGGDVKGPAKPRATGHSTVRIEQGRNSKPAWALAGHCQPDRLTLARRATSTGDKFRREILISPDHLGRGESGPCGVATPAGSSAAGVSTKAERSYVQNRDSTELDSRDRSNSMRRAFAVHLSHEVTVAEHVVGPPSISGSGAEAHLPGAKAGDSYSSGYYSPSTMVLTFRNRAAASGRTSTSFRAIGPQCVRRRRRSTPA
ncbi:MAG: hypothetical protein JWQ46_2252 [Phenylobacterium sp.]|nr:hypothetical protein [Phenylobacterium sp.]